MILAFAVSVHIENVPFVITFQIWKTMIEEKANKNGGKKKNNEKKEK